MKLHIRFIAIIALLFSAFSAHADNAGKYFDELSDKTFFNYSYISPTMLRLWGDNYISASGSHAYDNLPIQCKDITSIENVSTSIKGQDETLWKIIRKIKKDKNMETLTTRKDDNYRYDVLVTMSKDKKKITNLMVITQNGGMSVEVIYMEGKIPMESLQYSFY